jgi:hypothetical protein
MFYLMESATIIIFFARLSEGEGGCVKEYSLYACDNDEKDEWPLTLCMETTFRQISTTQQMQHFLSTWIKADMELVLCYFISFSSG